MKPERYKTKLKPEWVESIIAFTADEDLRAHCIRLQDGIARGITNKGIMKEWSEEKKGRRPHKDQRTYVHLELLPIEEMINKIGGAPCKTYKVKLSSLRLRTFKAHGTTCVKCGLEGTHWGIDHHRVAQDADPHMNLWSIKDGEEVLMTCDHIIPKSKGGPNTLKNTQIMCGPCNWNKGDKLEEEKS